MKARISIECGITIPEDGLINVWWWKDGAELNQEWQINKPLWEVFNSHEVFLLCVVGETIEVYEELILSNFIQVI